MVELLFISLLFLIESKLESYVIALKRSESNPEFNRLDKKEHLYSFIFAAVLLGVFTYFLWGKWFYILALIPLRRIFFDYPLPWFRSKVQGTEYIKYVYGAGFWDSLLHFVFRKRVVELVVELAFVIFCVVKQGM